MASTTWQFFPFNLFNRPRPKRPASRAGVSSMFLNTLRRTKGRRATRHLDDDRVAAALIKAEDRWHIYKMNPNKQRAAGMRFTFKTDQRSLRDAALAYSIGLETGV